MPVGSKHFTQDFVVVDRLSEGDAEENFEIKSEMMVRYVPLIDRPEEEEKKGEKEETKKEGGCSFDEQVLGFPVAQVNKDRKPPKKKC